MRKVRAEAALQQAPASSLPLLSTVSSCSVVGSLSPLPDCKLRRGGTMTALFSAVPLAPTSLSEE